MKKILYLLIAVAFFPIASYAYTLGTVSESSSYTGGITVESGRVISTGSSSASSEIQTTVTGGESGSTVEIKIETETDGVIHTESIKKKIPAGSGVTVTVGTTTNDASAEAEVRIGMPVPGSDDVVEMEVMDDDSDSSSVGEEHRSAVAKAVEALLSVGDRAGGIGNEIKEIAQEQKFAHDDASDAMNAVGKRNAFLAFLFGTDYGNLGKLRSSLVTSENGIERLMKARENVIDSSTKADLDIEIAVLQAENDKATAFIKEQEAKFSLFGWFFRLF